MRSSVVAAKPPAPAPAKGKGFEARMKAKVGPLPVYGWAIGLIAAYLLYRHYAGSAGGSSTATGTSLTPDTGGGVSGGGGMDAGGSPVDTGANSGTDPSALYQALLASENLNNGLFGLYAGSYPFAPGVTSTGSQAVGAPTVSAPVGVQAAATSAPVASKAAASSFAIPDYSGSFTVPELAASAFSSPELNQQITSGFFATANNVPTAESNRAAFSNIIASQPPSTPAVGDASRASATMSQQQRLNAQIALGSGGTAAGSGTSTHKLGGGL